MARSVGDLRREQVHAWGVRCVFGYPGDSIHGLIDAMGRAQDRIEFVQTRHEERDAYMACADAENTGEVGVCLATSGTSTIHLPNGLYHARPAHMPALTYSPPHRPAPYPVDAKRAIAETDALWRAWSRRYRSAGDWTEAARASAIALKTLTYCPTGGIVAAPTTSHPEATGGKCNQIR